MPYKCSVYGCKGNYDTGIKVSVFKFPTDLERKQVWTNRLMRKNFTPTKSSRVCELHFDEVDIVREASCFDERTGRLLTARNAYPRLREGAVPLYPLVPNFDSEKEQPSKDPSNPDYVPSVFDSSAKNTKKGKRKKEKILEIPEEEPTRETAEAWSSVLNLQPIESEAGSSGVNMSPEPQPQTTEPTGSDSEHSSPQPADPVVPNPKEKKPKKPKESPKKSPKPSGRKSGKRKVPRSPSPTENVPIETHTDPLQLCIVKMEIEDDGYNDDDNYLSSLPSTSSQPSPESQFSNLNFIKQEPIVPTVFKIVPTPTVKTASSDSQTVEAFFKTVAKTVNQLPPHLIEKTKAKVSSLVYDMVIQAINEGCTNIQQPEL